MPEGEPGRSQVTHLEKFSTTSQSITEMDIFRVSENIQTKIISRITQV